MNERQTSENERFKAKRQFWINCLSGEDPHAIRRQLTAMIWNAGAYRVVNEARRLAPGAEEGRVQLNGLVHQLIDDCFFESQIFAIRRLTDTYSLHGERGVYSLTGLLSDMKKNIALMTRAHIFAAEGLTYDHETVRENFMHYRAEGRIAGERFWGVPPELEWHPLARRHQQIDRLSGTTEHGRSSDDSVRADVFVRLKKKLTDAADKVKVCANKFVAHAATPENRPYARVQDIGLTLNHVWEAHKSLCQVTRFVSVVLLGDSMAPPLPTPQYDHFDYIDMPLVTADKIACLQEEWRQYDEESQQWTKWGLDEFEAECR